MPRLSIKRKQNPLTMIGYIGSKKISLLPVGQAPKPPAVIVFVQHLDDVTAAYGELIGPVSSVVVEWDDLEEDQKAGGTACVCVCGGGVRDWAQSRCGHLLFVELMQSLFPRGCLKKCGQEGADGKKHVVLVEISVQYCSPGWVCWQSITHRLQFERGSSSQMLPDWTEASCRANKQRAGVNISSWPAAQSTDMKSLTNTGENHKWSIFVFMYGVHAARLNIIRLVTVSTWHLLLL